MKYLLLYCILFLVNCVFSQSILEIESNIKKYEGNALIVNLDKLSEYYEKSNLDKAIEYSNIMYDECIKKNDDEYLAKSLLNLGGFYFQKGDYFSSIKYHNLLLDIYIKNSEYNNSGIVSNKIADAFYRQANYLKAIDYNTKSNVFFNKAKDFYSCAVVLNETGDYYLKLSNTIAALRNYEDALKTYKSVKDYKGVVISYNKLANANSKFGNFSKAKEYLIKALDIAKKNGFDKEILMLEQNISIVDRSSLNYSKSETEFSKSQTQEKNNTIIELAVRNSLSIEEINKLSEENQLKEYKIKSQEDELQKKKLIEQAKTRQNLYLLKEKENLRLQAEILLNRQNFILVTFTIFLLVLCLIIFLVYQNYKIKKKSNIYLESKNKEIISQKNIIESKNLMINDSLDCAKDIQSLILPSSTDLKKHFSDYFIFYEPKDVVSGDFYWMHEVENKCYFAVADCTGHGVPGAFVSFMANNLLNQIVSSDINISPAEVLQELNKRIIFAFKQNDNTRSAKYGLDIALIAYDKQNQVIDYAGARIPLLIVRNGKMMVISPDNFSVGNSLINEDAFFAEKKVELFNSDIIYFASDGFSDQKGGIDCKKFYSRTFRELLLLISSNDTGKQLNLLKQSFLEWKGENAQTDDILIFGFKV